MRPKLRVVVDSVHVVGAVLHRTHVHARPGKAGTSTGREEGGGISVASLETLKPPRRTYTLPRSHAPTHAGTRRDETKQVRVAERRGGRWEGETLMAEAERKLNMGPGLRTEFWNPCNPASACVSCATPAWPRQPRMPTSLDLYVSVSIRLHLYVSVSMSPLCLRV